MDTQSREAMPDFPLPRAGSPLDPPAEYDRFRTEGPLKKVNMWDGRQAWLVTRRDDVRAVLASPHFSADPTKPGYPFLTPARAAGLSAVTSETSAPRSPVRPRLLAISGVICWI